MDIHYLIRILEIESINVLYYYCKLTGYMKFGTNRAKLCIYFDNRNMKCETKKQKQNDTLFNV